MKLQSLTSTSLGYSPIHVEVSFIPGLPQVHFLGRADQSLKESELRIKSAFRKCGYKFPKAQKIIVNLTPSHIKKVSPGIELAVAIAILKMTGQGPEWNPQDFTLFGELGLDGSVVFPEVSRFFEEKDSTNLMSGPGFEKFRTGYQIENLKDLSAPEFVEKVYNPILKRPLSPVTKLTWRQAKYLKLIAAGGHHAMIAGSQGSGKTLLCEVLISLLPEPEAETLLWHETAFNQKIYWTPVARPHHTISPLSMVGGGVPPKPGEITRAHGGLLFLDEMMQFKPAALEALREALSSHEVTVSRGLQNKSFPADFQLVGTTNLCICGKWVPKYEGDCGYSNIRCESVRNRLSGPLMDRIQAFLFFNEKMEKPKVLVESLKSEIEKIRAFQKSRKRHHNRDFQEVELSRPELRLWHEFLEGFELGSVRRRQACLAWARTLADTEFKDEITKKHLDEAYEDTVLSYRNLIP